jgi:hypothetical protein
MAALSKLSTPALDWRLLFGSLEIADVRFTGNDMPDPDVEVRQAHGPSWI